MQCKGCEYALWNLRARDCPECGRPFRPSEYEFTQNSVAFRCPHCEQDYYGTGERGHLEPIAFNCVRCGQHIHMDEMVLLPTAGVLEEQTQVARMPWLDRPRRGFFRAWGRTVFMALFEPGTLMRLTPAASSTSNAIMFAGITFLIYTVLALLPLIFLFLAFASGGGMAMGVMSAALPLLVAIVVPVILIALWGLLAHGVLMLTGRREGGLGRTYQAVAYSSGASAAQAVPVIGFYLVLIGGAWWTISAGVMLAAAQRVAWWRATLAALVGPALVMVTLAALLVGSYSQRARVTTLVPVGNMMAQNVSSAYFTHLASNPGKPVRHAAELVADGLLQPSQLRFVNWGAAIPLGDTTLEHLVVASRRKQREAARAAAAALPFDVVAHRLGDFVFTWHGIDADTADGDLWLVIAAADLDVVDAGSSPVSTSSYAIATVDQQTVECQSEAEFVALLEAQNELRAFYRLPKLPHPRLVTHARPAVASQPIE